MTESSDRGIQDFLEIQALSSTLLVLAQEHGEIFDEEKGFQHLARLLGVETRGRPYIRALPEVVERGRVIGKVREMITGAIGEFAEKPGILTEFGHPGNLLGYLRRLEDNLHSREKEDEDTRGPLKQLVARYSRYRSKFAEIQGITDGVRARADELVAIPVSLETYTDDEGEEKPGPESDTDHNASPMSVQEARKLRSAGSFVIEDPEVRAAKVAAAAAEMSEDVWNAIEILEAIEISPTEVVGTEMIPGSGS